MASQYEPPAGFTLLKNPDLRSDEEIASVLQAYQPVTDSEKNVWTFWHTGWSGLRPWCQRNIINWVRRLGPEWTVRVVDDVQGSPNHLSRFISSVHLPNSYTDGTINGIPQHLSDLVRLPLIFLYGGVWMDAGMLLFRHLDDICWNEVSSAESPFEMAGAVLPLRRDAVSSMINGFIAGLRDNGMMRRWHAIYCKLWEGKTSAEGFHTHPLLTHLPPLAVQAEQMECPTETQMPQDAVADYLAHFTALERLQYLQDPTDGFDGADYFATRILKLQGMDHIYYAQQLTAWNGRRQHALLLTPVRPPMGGMTPQQQHSEARDFVHDLLRTSALMKLSHGPDSDPETLASIWDGEANADDDHVEGTFGEYLRVASAYWDATGPVTRTTVEKPEKIYKAGFLEII